MEGIEFQRKAVRDLVSRRFGLSPHQPHVTTEQARVSGNFGYLPMAARPRKVDDFQPIQDPVTGLFYFMFGYDRFGDPDHPMPPGS